MSRGLIAATILMLASGLAIAQTPPEEDKSLATPVFSFNPVQSEREVAIGNQYFSKGNYAAAISRYAAATKWNDGNAIAWLRLAQSREKKSDPQAARAAYEKYLEITPAGRDSAEVKKRLTKLRAQLH
jgi:tetratricopeptide (TPR) repeat protein